MNDLKILTCLLVVLEILDIILGRLHVRLDVSLGNISSLPDVKRVVGSLDNEDCPGIELLGLLSLVEIIHLDPARNFIWVFWLVG